MSTCASDPLQILPAPNGGSATLLKISGVTSRPELNLKFAYAISFSDGRYVVALVDAATAAAAAVATARHGQQEPKLVKLNPSALNRASWMDQVKFSMAVALEAAKLYTTDPRLVAVGRRLTPAPLRAMITPEQSLAAIALILPLLFLLLGYLVGLTKLLVSSSLLGLLLLVSSADWIEGLKQEKPFHLILKVTAKNFITRWKQMLVHNTGYPNISDRMAIASLVLLLLWSGKILLMTPKPSPSATITMPQPPKYDLEFIYKLGYDDAKSGEVFGASLPQDVVTTTSSSVKPHKADDSFDWAYDPPPKMPLKKAGLGVGTMFSLFALIRFGKDLVTYPNGQIILDPNQIWMKLKAMEPWRLGLMFISLYRLIGAVSSMIR